ncbi:hypothetical protein NE237_011772 [Protea cynaroides]|uniref:Uncharacterized protein n=1 Tax=Protea cynaroides TaxID=273540 RepID=A0A9Q0GWQ2_9MAGN|nr:hypothetical protein NE237_011772 [Protea cynaroides]
MMMQTLQRFTCSMVACFCKSTDNGRPDPMTGDQIRFDNWKPYPWHMNRIVESKEKLRRVALQILRKVLLIYVRLIKEMNGSSTGNVVYEVGETPEWLYKF